MLSRHLALILGFILLPVGMILGNLGAFVLINYYFSGGSVYQSDIGLGWVAFIVGVVMALAGASILALKLIQFLRRAQHWVLRH